MSATASQPPVIPPRPSRSQDKDQIPQIPPRPIKLRIDRSMSPSRDRFAPSPLNERLGGANGALSPRFGNSGVNNGFGGSPDPIDRSSSVDLPSLGEEGMEYAAMTQELESGKSSPEQTRNVDKDLKLHAPKPSHPAVSAKQRVATVTRTDSDRAASFGIGKPSSDEPASSNRSLRKKASTISQLSARSDNHVDDEQGIPEIGKQVPMYKNAGDVQAPSPAPGLTVGPDGQRSKNHTRKGSSRGFNADLPPGSYGLHGHGVKPQDKLDKAYYEKHPDLMHRDRPPHHHDRPNDFSMSREELNKIVRDTANNRLSGVDFSAPPEHAGWEAIEESTSRITSPKPMASGPGSPVLTRSHLGVSPEAGKSNENVIHVEDPRRKSGQFDIKSPGSIYASDEDDQYTAPILADDEVSKNNTYFDLHPAVDPGPERVANASQTDPSSRPKSRPTSIYRESSHDIRSTPLEDVQEYEPLFPEEDKSEKLPKPESPTATRRAEERKHKFPSRDVWEDAPDSVHGTAEVSTSDIPEQQDDNENDHARIPRVIPPRETDTPAQAFARRQEELAEAESRDNPDAFLYRTQKPSWVQGQTHLAKEVMSRTPSAQSARSVQSAHSTHQFPSRDVWEDTPDSHMLEAEVSKEQGEDDDEEEDEDEDDQQSGVEPNKAPGIPQRPVRKQTDPMEKPTLPERPKPKHTPSDDGSVSKPTIPERPKPQVPARPQRQSSGSSSKEAESAAPSIAKTKPPVPARPVGGKIAALQAGFMADLNKRLQLGPQVQKHEEPVKEEESPVEQEKAPLADARKGRARGPQRRAPAKSPAPPAGEAVAPEKNETATFSFSAPVSFFSVDPDEGCLTIGAGNSDKEPLTETTEAKEPVEIEQLVAKKVDTAESDRTTETAAKSETLATNMAGDALLKVDVEKTGKNIEPVNVEEGQLEN